MTFAETIASLTVEQFDAWLKAQPAKRKFEYMNCQACLVASFVRENTVFKEASAGGNVVAPTCETAPCGIPGSVEMPEWLNEKAEVLLQLDRATAGKLRREYKKGVQHERP